MDSKPQKTVKKMPPMEIPADLEPVYINLVRISHTHSEMIFDFARMLPGDTDVPVKTRTLMSPLSAKLFYRALGENLAKYEPNFGEIQLPGKGSSLAEHLFKPPQK